MTRDRTKYIRDNAYLLADYLRKTFAQYAAEAGLSNKRLMINSSFRCDPIF